jgi:hypothetical protein
LPERLVSTKTDQQGCALANLGPHKGCAIHNYLIRFDTFEHKVDYF